MHTLRGKIIVIEGGDGVGKQTQTELLRKALSEEMSVTVMSFPRYETPTGKVVKECLAGVHGDFLALSPYIASGVYVVDQMAALPEMRVHMEEGVLLCDRYAPTSNMVYQAAKLADPHERDAFIRYFEHQQYQELGLPRPDCVVYLSSSVRINSALMDSRAEKDQHEASASYQEAVVALYRRIAQERDHWHIVECLEDGVLLSREAIHQKVMDVVRGV